MRISPVLKTSPKGLYDIIVHTYRLPTQGYFVITNFICCDIIYIYLHLLLPGLFK